MPILDIPDWTCHRHRKRKREGEGKMLGRHFIWLKEGLEAVGENIVDDGHCKIRGIRNVHWIITKPNKPNGVRAYSSSLLHVIITHNHLLFFKIFWNFVHFCPNSQIFFPISIFLGSFSEKSQLLPFTFENRPWVYLLEPNKPNGVLIREYGFLCNVYIKGRVESCQAAEPNQYFWHSIDVLKAKWY